MLAGFGYTDAQRSEDRRFEELFGRHGDALNAYCRALVGDEDDANDVLQNVALGVLLALRRGVKPSQERAWLYRIAYNEAVSLCRGRAIADRAEQMLPPADDGPEQAMLLKERLAETFEDVNALSPRRRQVLLMSELTGLSREEIGARLRLSPKAVGHDLSRARARVRADRTAREVPCQSVRAKLSGSDGRRRRTAEVRAHMRGCRACRSWQSRGVRRSSNVRARPAS